MADDPFSLDHLLPAEGSMGPRSGIADNFYSGFEQAFRVDSAYSLEAELDNRWQENLRRISEITGQKVDAPAAYAPYGAYARELLGEDLSWWQTADGDYDSLPPLQKQMIEALRQQDKLAGDMRRADVKTFGQILADVRNTRAAIEQENARVSQTAGLPGTIAHFIGGMAGSTTTRDPLMLATLGIGGFGRQIATRIATEGVIQGGLEAATQYGAIQPTRRALGEETYSPVESVLQAATVGALFRGAGEAAVAGARVLRERGQLPSFDLDDKQLAQMFENNQNVPEARAGAHILDNVQRLEVASPYGTDYHGMRRFNEELAQYELEAFGRTDTAVVRTLPEAPIDFRLLDLDVEQVKVKAPDVVTRVEAANARLEELDTRIDELTTGLQDVTLPSRLEQMGDLETAELVRGYEQALAEPGLSVRKREEVTKSLRQIEESVRSEVDRGDQAFQNARIAPKKELQRARKERRAAKEEYRKARREFDVELGKVRAEQRVTKLREGREMVDTVAAMQDAPLGSLLRYDQVAAAVQSTRELVEIAPERTKAVVQQSTVPREDGLFDLGDGQMIEPDFEITLTNLDGSTVTMSAREVFEDLAEDEALTVAIRSCLV